MVLNDGQLNHSAGLFTFTLALISVMDLAIRKKKNPSIFFDFLALLIPERLRLSLDFFLSNTRTQTIKPKSKCLDVQCAGLFGRGRSKSVICASVVFNIITNTET